MSKETGGNAFPFEGTVHLSSSKGMSLRDYFAAKAMVISMEGSRGFGNSYVDEEYYGQLAEHAYKIADAMIKARGE